MNRSSASKNPVAIRVRDGVLSVSGFDRNRLAEVDRFELQSRPPLRVGARGD
jgi:hypothetical protein